MSNNVEGLSEGVEDRRRMSGVSKGIGEGLGDDVEGYDQGRDTTLPLKPRVPTRPSRYKQQSQISEDKDH